MSKLEKIDRELEKAREKAAEWQYVCPFAVRVPAGLSLADFLGSMLTRTIALSRRTRHTDRKSVV